MEFTIPVHPDEKHLPRSYIQFQTSEGEVIVLAGVPMNGPKTLKMISKTLDVWKPALVRPEPPELEFSI
jgi:hypothetical protein